MSGAKVYFKCENLQHTGSFKVRGALSKLLSLPPAERAKGVITASTGNHGAGVACAARQAGVVCTVFAPGNAAPAKLAAFEELGGTVHRAGADCVLAEAEARRFAAVQAKPYISPYNDPQVIGGQGTVGVELVGQIERIDALFAALGGGGLITGIAAHVKSAHHNTDATVQKADR